MTQDIKIRLSLDGASQVQAGATAAAGSLGQLGQATQTAASAAEAQALASAQQVAATKAVAAATQQAATGISALESSQLAQMAAQLRLEAATARNVAAQTALARAASDVSSAQGRIADLAHRAAVAQLEQAQAAAALTTAVGNTNRLTAAQATLGQQTKLTGNQMAQLSAQAQDFFVQVQAGGSVMTAAIQQASGLASGFGGVTPALKAIGTVLTPTVLGLSAAVAVALGFGLAAKAGADDAKELADALTLTNNAAGLTQGSFSAMADGIAKDGKRAVGAVRDMGQELAKTGAFGQVGFLSATRAAERYAEATGKTAKDTAADFARMAADPTKWAESLSKSYGAVTAKQFEYIKSLQERGQIEQAQAVVTDALNAHLAKLDDNLGLIDRTLKAGKNLWSDWWDAAKGIGKAETAEEALARIQKAVQNANKPLGYVPTAGELYDRALARNAGNPAIPAAGESEAQALARVFREAENATAEALRTASNKAGVDISKDLDKAKTSVQALDDALTKFKANAATARLAITDPEELKKFDAQVKATESEIVRVSAATGQKLDAMVAQAAAAAQKRSAEIAKELAATQAKYTGSSEVAAAAALLLIQAETKAKEEQLKVEIKLAEAEKQRALAKGKVGEPNPAATAAQTAIDQKTAALQQVLLAGEKDLAAANAKRARERAAEFEAQQQEVTASLALLDKQEAAAVREIANLKLEADERERMLAVELSVGGASNAQRSIAIEQLRIQLQLERQLAKLDDTPFDTSTARQAAKDQLVMLANRDKAAAIAKIYADEFNSTADQINKTLAESITDALMGDGVSAGQALRRELLRIFSQPLQVAIQGVLQPVSNSLASWALGGQQQGASGAAGGANSLSSLSSLYGMGKQAWGWLGSGAGTGTAAAGAFVDSGGIGAASNAALAEYGIYSSGALSSAAYGSAVNEALAQYGITSSSAAAGGTAAAGAGASSAAAAIPIIGWIVAALMASDAAYKGGNSTAMIGGTAKWGTPGGALSHLTYETLSGLGFSEKWAQVLSGAPLVARLFGHKASSSGYGIGSVYGGDFVGDSVTPFQYGDNTLGTGRNQDLEGLSSDVLAAVGIAAGNFGGKLKDGLRVGSFTDRDREGKVAALLGYFGDKNTLIAGTQTGTGAFGVGGPNAAGQKIDGADFEKWVAEQMPLLVVQGLKQSDLDARFKEFFDTVDLSKIDPTKAASKADEMLQTATNVAKVTEAFKPLGGALGQLNTITVQSVADLAQVSGGFDALGQSTAAYYQAYYSDSERAAASTKGIGDALGKVGLQLPDLSHGADAARSSWRAMLDAQDLSTAKGREAAAALLGLSGSFDQLAAYADNLQKAVKSFDTSGFLGEAATLANQRQQLADGFAAINRQVPKTRAEFGALVHELQEGGTATEPALKAVLNLVDGFDAVASAAEAAAKEQKAAADEQKAAADRARQQVVSVWAGFAQTLVQNVANAYQQVQQQVDAASQQVRAEAEDQARKVQADADQSTSKLEAKASDIERNFTSMLTSVADSVRKLQGDIAGDGGRERALQDLRAARDALQIGGTVDFDRVREAAATASNIDPNRFATRLDFQREQARTANLLRDIGTSGRVGMTQLLGGIAAQQVTIEAEADKQIKTIEKARDAQLAALQDQLLQAQGIAGTLINIDKGVGTVADAIAALRTASTAASASVNTWVKTGGQEVWASTGGAVATRPENTTPQTADTSTVIQGRSGTFTVAEARAFALDKIAKGDIVGLYARLVAEGIDSRSFDALMGYTPGTSLAEALRRGLPAFEVGSPFVPQTGLAVVHQGERIFTAADNRAVMQMLGQGGNAGLLAEMRAMRAELEALRLQAMNNDAVLAAYTGKSARLLDDVINGGATLRTEVAA